jgi:hypothetical protein
VQLIQDKISKATLKACIRFAESAQYKSLHGAGDGSYGFKNTIYDIDKIACFNQIYQELIPYIPNEYEIYRSYINAMSFGMEDTIHQDEIELEDGMTLLIYLCNGWFPEWFGQTVFFKNIGKDNNREKGFFGAEIAESILPRYNLAILFDKNIYHCVSPISRRFAGVRYTCMFKLKKI